MQFGLILKQKEICQKIIHFWIEILRKKSSDLKCHCNFGQWKSYLATDFITATQYTHDMTTRTRFHCKFCRNTIANETLKLLQCFRIVWRCHYTSKMMWKLSKNPKMSIEMRFINSIRIQNGCDCVNLNSVGVMRRDKSNKKMNVLIQMSA